MDNLGFGLTITLAGMGSVFALLLLLTGLLVLIGRLDRRSAALEAPAAAVAPPLLKGDALVGAPDAPPGLDPALVAAIGLAVVTHTRELRRQAGPAMRAHPPGSLDHASRWVATGRGAQTKPWRRGSGVRTTDDQRRRASGEVCG